MAAAYAMASVSSVTRRLIVICSQSLIIITSLARANKDPRIPRTGAMMRGTWDSLTPAAALGEAESGSLRLRARLYDKSPGRRRRHHAFRASVRAFVRCATSPSFAPLRKGVGIAMRVGGENECEGALVRAVGELKWPGRIEVSGNGAGLGAHGDHASRLHGPLGETHTSSQSRPRLSSTSESVT